AFTGLILRNSWLKTPHKWLFHSAILRKKPGTVSFQRFRAFFFFIKMSIIRLYVPGAIRTPDRLRILNANIIADTYISIGFPQIESRTFHEL
ncbi:hypothetical protein DP120_18175, partial [Planococcus halotolerans]